ncbi:DNA polymerase III subunit delta' [Salinarimonas ramus]|uniref:DNA polymerase III subunit delta n=1 Tax=Salinarimonas ramus TaxID=690164 RepID=A0A917QG18_9HYPH|nr:DNA polymerase III subunit delta' [Salinarimonas ramus]GGK48188.1 DNA polymerase III subunit delta' [Salinarimonas ramus]
MADKTPLAEPDQLPGAPHPRERDVLFGHEEAERAFLDAYGSGRLHHAWLIGGPEGIGKATLAYRVAKFVLDRGGRTPEPVASLDVPEGSRAARQVSVLSHPGLFVLRRVPATEKKAASTTIPVDEVRRALQLFGSTAADAGYRVCIVDAADDLIPASANALLKMVEEPPPRSLFLILSHAPQRVLPTIRSRCRKLLLRPLADDPLARVIRSLPEPIGSAPDDALSTAIGAAEGSARRAIALLDPERARTVQTVEGLLAALPAIDWRKVGALADRLARRGAEQDLELTLETVERWAISIVETRAGEGARRLAPLVEVCEKSARAAAEADTYNLDRRPLVLTLFGDLAEAVRATR